MDTTLILTRTAKGVVAAKTEDGKLHYDAVRLLRQVNGKATAGELRAQFSDLTEIRFQKALSALEDKGLVRALPANAPDPGERFEIPRLEKQLQDLGKEFMQSLDFTTLERKLLEAMRSSPAPAAATAPAPESAAPARQVAAVADTKTESPAQRARSAVEVQLRAELLPVLRTRIEQELRAKLSAALRPLVEEELRRQIIVTLRPVLEAEIRTKLTAALKPRVELELRARLESEAANPASGPHPRLLECIRETVFQTDLAGNSVYVNARWARLTGYAREETLGRPFAQFFVREDQGGMAGYSDGVARGAASPVVFEAHLARKTGAPLRVAIRAAPYTAPPGTIAGVCGTLRGVGAASAAR